MCTCNEQQFPQTMIGHMIYELGNKSISPGFRWICAYRGQFFAMRPCYRHLAPLYHVIQSDWSGGLKGYPFMRSATWFPPFWSLTFGWYSLEHHDISRRGNQTGAGRVESPSTNLASP